MNFCRVLIYTIFVDLRIYSNFFSMFDDGAMVRWVWLCDLVVTFMTVIDI
ncbi:MAG: hypothetical protein ABSA84_08515 [Gammaproteobacteria bacterium]